MQHMDHQGRDTRVAQGIGLLCGPALSNVARCSARPANSLSCSARASPRPVCSTHTMISERAKVRSPVSAVNSSRSESFRPPSSRCSPPHPAVPGDSGQPQVMGKESGINCGDTPTTRCAFYRSCGLAAVVQPETERIVVAAGPHVGAVTMPAELGAAARRLLLGCGLPSGPVIAHPVRAGGHF